MLGRLLIPFFHQNCSKGTDPHLYLQHFKASTLHLSRNLNPKAAFCITNVSFSVALLTLKEASHRLREGNDIVTQSSATACREQNTPTVTDNMLFPPGNVGCTVCQMCRVGMCHLLNPGGLEFPDLLPKRIQVTEPTQSHICTFTWVRRFEL